MSHSADVSPRDPRLRPYRIAVWIVYFVVLLFGIGLMALSVGRNVLAPGPSPAEGQAPTREELRSCIVDLELLLQEQNQRGVALAVGAATREPIQAWKTWAADWEKRLDRLRARCGLSTPSAGPEAELRAELARAWDALQALHRAYVVQVDRLADEQASRTEAARQALARAREQAARER
jgi:hypothetical protein